jgi:hypothetical protein
VPQSAQPLSSSSGKIMRPELPHTFARRKVPASPRAATWLLLIEMISVRSHLTAFQARGEKDSTAELVSNRWDLLCRECRSKSFRLELQAPEFQSRFLNHRSSPHGAWTVQSFDDGMLFSPDPHCLDGELCGDHPLRGFVKSVFNLRDPAGWLLSLRR